MAFVVSRHCGGFYEQSSIVNSVHVDAWTSDLVIIASGKKTFQGIMLLICQPYMLQYSLDVSTRNNWGSQVNNFEHLSFLPAGALHWGPMSRGFGLPEQWYLMSRRGRHDWKHYLPTRVWTIEILQIFLYFRSIHVKGSCYLEIVNFVINMYYSLNWSVSSDKRSHSPMIKK